MRDSVTAICAAGRLAGHPGAVSDRSADVLCRDSGSRRCAYCRPDPRQPATAHGSRSRGQAATLVSADLAPGLDDLGKGGGGLRGDARLVVEIVHPGRARRARARACSVY